MTYLTKHLQPGRHDTGWPKGLVKAALPPAPSILATTLGPIVVASETYADDGFGGLAPLDREA